jgi:hypothetical protein
MVGGRFGSFKVFSPKAYKERQRWLRILVSKLAASRGRFRPRTQKCGFLCHGLTRQASARGIAQRIN